MKNLYKKTPAQFLFFLFFCYTQTSLAQCPGGAPNGGVAYDSTVFFPIGVVHKQIKFPKFNPQTGMLSCVKLIISMKGIVDTVAVQNYSVAPLNTNLQYTRNDQMTGPGLTPMLSNSYNHTIGPATLAPYDGVPGSGPDFYSSSKDTIFQNRMSRTLTDSTEISNFYGTDSVTYDYDILVNTTSTIGGSGALNILTSAFVTFRFEYCTCPIITLPAGLNNFNLAKSSAKSAQLTWEAEKDDAGYVYEIQMSRDGRNFTRVDMISKKAGAYSTGYLYNYAMKNGEWGKYYFRVKQRWLSNGYSRFTDIKMVEFENPVFSNVSLYPNPASGVVGLKFISGRGGRFVVQISNAGGQIVLNKEILVAETDYKTIGNLNPGMYYVKLIDVASHDFIVHQLVVK